MGWLQNSTSKKIGCTARGQECALTGNYDHPKLEKILCRPTFTTPASNPRVNQNDGRNTL